MEKQLLKLLINILGLYVMAEIVPVIKIDGIISIILFGLVLWLVNFLVRPLLLLLALPLNLLTFGIITLFINTWMVMLTDTLLKDFLAFICTGITDVGF